MRDVVRIMLDGETVEVPAAVSVAVALARHDRLRSIRSSSLNADPRSVFCGMGLCQECVVTVDGVRGVRACITPIAEGMQIQTALKHGRETDEVVQ